VATFHERRSLHGVESTAGTRASPKNLRETMAEKTRTEMLNDTNLTS